MLFKASIIKIPIMLALNNIKYKASINGILIMLALKFEVYKVFAYIIYRNVPINIYSV